MKNRSIMNAVEHCLVEMAFLDSNDVPSNQHSGTYVFNFMDDTIKDLREENVVHIIYNASNNIAVNMLASKRPDIF